MDESYLLYWNKVQFDKRLTFVDEPVSILVRDVRRLNSRDVVKIQWRHNLFEGVTYEVNSDMNNSYPKLFTISGIYLPFSLRTN